MESQPSRCSPPRSSPLSVHISNRDSHSHQPMSSSSSSLIIYRMARHLIPSPSADNQCMASRGPLQILLCDRFVGPHPLEIRDNRYGSQGSSTSQEW
ncbi:hypothetical protein Tco_0996483 [Tanacetum coccineum]